MVRHLHLLARCGLGTCTSRSVSVREGRLVMGNSGNMFVAVGAFTTAELSTKSIDRVCVMLIRRKYHLVGKKQTDVEDGQIS